MQNTARKRAAASDFPTQKERAAAGKALRRRVPRPSHGEWKLPRATAV
jgi:hypothetical protein